MNAPTNCRTSSSPARCRRPCCRRCARASASAAAPRRRCASSTAATSRPSRHAARGGGVLREHRRRGRVVRWPAHAVPVIPFGVGSSLEGHLLAVQGGVSIDLSRMNRVLRVNPEDLTVTVQAGVTREQLNREIRDTGLFFPIDPGANASLGGMAATRASGTNAVRYGTMRENVLGLTVVTPAARSSAPARARRSRQRRLRPDAPVRRQRGHAGRDDRSHAEAVPAARGGERGDLPLPEHRRRGATTIQIIQMGVPIARCELLDANAVRAVNEHSKLGLREAPMLLMEFHGSEAGVKEQAETVQEIAASSAARTSNGPARPRSARGCGRRGTRPTSPACRLNPGCRCVTTDTCVPISRLAEIIEASVAEADASGLPYYIVGHVGDGNFHLAYLVKDGDASSAKRPRPEHADGAARDRAGRHLHRRTRHRPAQDGLPGRRGRCRRGGDDAHHQARARPEEHHESGQGPGGGRRGIHPRDTWNVWTSWAC
jgi:D-lactate dehydrogenase (cytochrome)